LKQPEPEAERLLAALEEMPEFRRLEEEPLG